MGFVAKHTSSWQWIYWIFSTINGIQFVLYLLLSPETIYLRNTPKPTSEKSTSWRKYVTINSIGTATISPHDFGTPFSLFMFPAIFIPAAAYSIIFGFCSVLLTVEIPQIFIPKWSFDPEQIGLQFLSLIIGSIIGEQLSGRGSDYWMRQERARLGPSRRVRPEHRIWLSYVGFLASIVGLVVFCVQVNNVSADRYNITPLVGIAIAAFGNQVVTTVLVTFAVDSHPEHSASIGVFINLVRNTWGFISPFWFPYMLTNLGLKGSAGLMSGLILMASVVPVMWLHRRGTEPRKEGSDRTLD